MERGLEIKIRRTKSKMTALELSRKLEISPTKLSLIENGHKTCPDHLYTKIRNILKNI
ncbi:MAG: helix-turn-helix domain-containing protein [Lutispora sp.]|nr:helix-turn-helix domain-containing protein [Lutispora sp.]